MDTNQSTQTQRYLDSSMRIEEYGIYSYLFNRYIDHAENDLFYKETAKAICYNGGKILQIGFGLGNLSYYIQGHDIESHDIIEDHPEIAGHARELGYEIFQGNVFQFLDECIKQGMQYDGVYCMCTSIYDKAFLPEFHKRYLDKILKPGGVYSYRLNTIEGSNINARWQLDALNYVPEITFIPLLDAYHYVDGNTVNWDITVDDTAPHPINWFTKPLNKEE